MTSLWADVNFDHQHGFLSAVRESASGYAASRPIELSDGATLEAVILERDIPAPDMATYRDLARRDQFVPHFLVWRAQERLGRFAPDHDDDYVLALVGLATRTRPLAIERLLRGDDELRETTLWRIFEVEGGGEVSFTQGERDWTTVLSALAADGTIDRARVLRSALEAVGRDFSSYRAGGFRRLYDALTPTPEERAADQALLWPLFGASVSQTVTWAGKAAAVLERAGMLDDDAFVAASSAAVLGTKAASVSAMKLLAMICKRRDDLQAEAVDTIVLGLTHADVAVQEQAVKTLHALGRPALVAEHADGLSPSLRTALGLGGGEVAGADGDVTAGPAPLSPLGPESVRDLLPAAIEDTVDAVVFEAVLAQIALDGIEDTLAISLRRRALQVLDREGTSLRRTAVAVVAAWTDAGQVDVDTAVARRWRTQNRVGRDDDQPWPLSDRTAEAIARAAARTTGVTLWATPTDTAGRVDAATLVARARANQEPSEADAAGAFLRLAADGRAEALRSAADLTGPAAAALRFALGGEVPQPEAVLAEPRLWACASRARGDRSVLAAAGLGSPGWGAPQTVNLSMHEVHWGENDRWHAWRPLIQVDRPDDQLPPSWTIESPDTVEFFYSDDLRAAEWAALIAPDDLEPFASRLLQPLARHVEWDESDHRIVPALTGLLAASGAPSAISAACVVVALGVKRPDGRALAIDLFCDMMLRRDALAPLTAAARTVTNGVPAQRWASVLAEIAGISPRLSAAVRMFLAGALPAFDTGHLRIGSLLQVLLDETVRGRARADDTELRTWLSQFRGSSAAAKTAKRLLELG